LSAAGSLIGVWEPQPIGSDAAECRRRGGLGHWRLGRVMARGSVRAAGTVGGPPSIPGGGYRHRCFKISPSAMVLAP
jgi:hypothetical protein